MTRLVPEPRRIGRGRRGMPLDAILEGARAGLTRAAGGPGALVLDLRSTGALHAERAVIERVLEELVACSRRSSPDGCRITIRTRDLEGGIEVVVHDLGGGSEAEAALRTTVVAPLLAAAPATGDVRPHCDVAHLGRGTTARLVLPRADAATGPLVLLAEDDAVLREILIVLLHDAGYQVLAAFDGQAALSMVRDRKVDLLLTDVDMPRMGGVELARRLTAKQPGLPVLFMSGSSAAPAEGAFIAKPFAMDELEAQLERLHPRHESSASAPRALAAS